MPHHRSLLLVLSAALLTALLSSCGARSAESSALPDGARLLADSAEAMRAVTTTRISLDVEGELPGAPIKSAQAQLTRDGSAKGTAMLDMGRQPFEITFVILGTDFYLQGPVGGFQKLSTSSAFLTYDPTAILNPDRGIARILDRGTAAETEDREQVDGADSYRVRASFPAESLSTLVPGFTTDSPSRVWISAEDFRLVQAQFPTNDGSVTLHFSDYGAPADIRAPR
jgi:lipoprotein LprG